MLTIAWMVAGAFAAEGCDGAYTLARLHAHVWLAESTWAAGDADLAREAAARAEAGLRCLTTWLDPADVEAAVALLVLTEDGALWGPVAARGPAPPWPIPEVDAAARLDLHAAAASSGVGVAPSGGRQALQIAVRPGQWRVDGAPVDRLDLPAGEARLLQRFAGEEVETLLWPHDAARIDDAARERAPREVARTHAWVERTPDGEIEVRREVAPQRRPALAAGSVLLVAAGGMLAGHVATSAAFDRWTPTSAEAVERRAAVVDALAIGAGVVGVAGAGALGFGVWVSDRGGGVWGRF
jgi:hypothetical protein